MKIVIPDDYQDMVDQLPCFSLIRHHDVKRYREPARDLDQLVDRLKDADVVVSIRERVEFSRALLERLPKLKLIALVGRNSHMLDFAAATDLGIPVSTGVSNSPVAPAELTLALIVASRRNVALEAERMRAGQWPCTLSHRLRGSTLGIFGLGHIGALVAEGGKGLGMKVLVWGQKNSLEKATAAGYKAAKSKADLFERSDVLSISVRLRPEDARHRRRGRSGADEADGAVRQRGARRAGGARYAARRSQERPAGLRRDGCVRGGAGHRRQPSVSEDGQRAVHAASRVGRMGQLRALFPRVLPADRGV
jgi:lactate dehydrogenase-like 2-hydroxyacid dehydrogenase